MEAKRYNSGKLRYELISKLANKEKAKVYTLGAHKYSLYEDNDGRIIKGADLPISEISSYKLIDDGANNWKKGLKTTNVLDSLRRHIEAFAVGEDYDSELGTFHLANAAWNIDVLLEQYTTHPELDDRQLSYLNMPKIGLDIDDVICDFVPAFMERFGLKEPKNWAWSYSNEDRFDSLTRDPEVLKEFYLSLKPKVNPDEIPFEPHCYITSRSVPKEVTKQWIEDNGFACKPVWTVPFQTSKIEVAKQSGIEVYVDDKYENFVEFNNAGIFCYLFDAPHNQRYNVGSRRIYKLSDIVSR